MNDDVDVIDIELLPDGRIKSTTDPISAGNHQSAEGFFRTLARLTGGDMTKVARHAKRHKHQHKQPLKVKQ